MLTRVVAGLILLGCAHDASTGSLAKGSLEPSAQVAWPPEPLSPEVRRVIESGTLFRVGPALPPRTTKHQGGCVLSGFVDEVALPLFPSADASEPLAALEQGDFERVQVPRSLDAPIEAELKWPLHGKVYLRQESLPFSLRAPVPLQAGLAWLGPGARVAATSSDGSHARVVRDLAGPKADFAPATFASSLPCDALALAAVGNLFPDDPAMRGPSIPEGGELAELTKAAPLSAQPGSATTLRVGGPGWPVQLHEMRGAWALVSERMGARWTPRGFDFLGWVPSASVRRGGLPYAVALGRVELQPSHRACGNAGLRLEPQADAPIVARVSDALPLLVYGHRGDFAAVMVPGLLSTQHGLWVHRSKLCR